MEHRSTHYEPPLLRGLCVATKFDAARDVPVRAIAEIIGLECSGRSSLALSLIRRSGCMRNLGTGATG